MLLIYIMTLNVSVVMFILILLILIHSIKHLLFHKSLKINDKHVFVETIKKNQKRGKIKKKALTISFKPYIRYTTIICLAANLIGNAAALSQMFILIIRPSTNLSAYPILLSYIGRAVMNSVFLTRLKYSFRNTKWSYSTKVFRLLYGLLSANILMATIAAAISIIQIFLGVSESADFSAIHDTIRRLTFLVMFILDTICSIILSYLYQHKLVQLTKSYFISFQNTIKTKEFKEMELPNISLNGELNINDRSQTHSIISLPEDTASKSSKTHNQMFYDNIISDCVVIADEAKSPELQPASNHKSKSEENKVCDHTRLELINTITQCTLLVSISFITSLFVLFARVIALFISSSYYDDNNMMALRNLLFWLRFIVGLDIFINSLCFYLQFPFSLKMYKSICCLHQRFLLCVGKCIDKTILSESD